VRHQLGEARPFGLVIGVGGRRAGQQIVDLVPELGLVLGGQVISQQGLDQPVHLNGPGGRVDGRQREPRDVPDYPGEHDRRDEDLGQLRPGRLHPVAEHVPGNWLGAEEGAAAQQLQRGGVAVA
jgi:hypothetical protein